MVEFMQQKGPQQCQKYIMKHEKTGLGHSEQKACDAGIHCTRCAPRDIVGPHTTVALDHCWSI
jgi:hypothetical protein